MGQEIGNTTKVIQDETLLIQRILDGQTALFRQIANRYAGQVMRMVGRLIPSPEEAEEATQDTLLEAFQSLARYDARKASFQTWLMRIAHANLSGNKLCDDLTAFYQAEMKVITDWQKSRLENNPNPGPASLADMGPEYTERREKLAIDLVNRHTSDILGYYLLHEVAINYMPPAKWQELFNKMEPWLKTKPTLYKYLSQFKAEREKNL